MSSAVTLPSPSARRRRRAVLAGVGLAVAAAVGATLVIVGGRHPADGPAPPTSAPAAPVLPLLGTPGAAPARAALAVKIDDTAHGRPPTGLTRADVVFEEMVEGGLTRLMAVYQSQDPPTVGPVRSARSTDLFFLAELGRPLFAWSGANPTFAAAVRGADVIDVGAGAAPQAYRRSPDRPAPYDLYATTALLRRAAAPDGAATTPPDPLFSFRAPGAPLSGPGVRATTGYRTVDRGPLATAIEWTWDPAAAAWTRRQDGTPHVDADGRPIRAANVIIRITPYRASGVRVSTGAAVPEAAAVGEGDAWLLSDGRAQPGRWHKPSPHASTTYTDARGAPLRLTPGPTWVEVLPLGSGTVG